MKILILILLICYFIRNAADLLIDKHWFDKTVSTAAMILIGVAILYQFIHL